MSDTFHFNAVPKSDAIPLPWVDDANSSLFVIGSKSRTSFDRSGHPRFQRNGVAEIFVTGSSGSGYVGLALSQHFQRSALAGLFF